MEPRRAIYVIVLVSAKRRLVVPRRAMTVIPARVGVMQIVMMLLARCRNFENVNFGRPAILQSPERRPRTLLPRSLEAALDVAILDFKFALGINRARSVIDRYFFVVELSRFSIGFRVLFLFALELERSIGNNHVLFGTIGTVVVGRTPVVSRVPLFLVKRSAVKVILEHEIPAANIRRRIRKNIRRQKSK